MTSKFLSKAVAAAAFGGASLLIASPGIALAGDGHHDGHRKAGWVYAWPGHTTPGGTVTIVEICKKPQEKPWVWSEATGKLWLEPATDKGHHKKDHEGKGDKEHKGKDHKADKSAKGHEHHKGHKDHKKDHKAKDHHADKKHHKKDKKDKKFFDGEAKWWEREDQQEKFFFEENLLQDLLSRESAVEDLFQEGTVEDFFSREGTVEDLFFQEDAVTGDAEAEVEEAPEADTYLSYELMSLYRDEPKRDKDHKKHEEKKLFEAEAEAEAEVEVEEAEAEVAEDEAAETYGKDHKKGKKGKKDKKHKKHPWAYFAEVEISKKVQPGEYTLYGSCGEGKLIVAPKGSVDAGFGTGSDADPALLASGAGMLAAAALGGSVLLRRRATDGTVA